MSFLVDSEYSAGIVRFFGEPVKFVLGDRTIDAGGLRMARSLEEMELLPITLNARNGRSRQSGRKPVGTVGSAT